jgi:hypothetical protein
MRPKDTDLDSWMRQIAALRALSPQERLLIAISSSDEVRQLALDGARHRQRGIDNDTLEAHHSDMADRWFEVDHPVRSGRGVRSCGVQVGWRPFFYFEAGLDTGYRGSLFEFTFGVSVGPYDWSFDWRPTRG